MICRGMVLKIVFILMLVLFIIFSTDQNNLSYAQSAIAWQKLSGPWDPDCDGSFQSIAIHPDDPNVVYIGNNHETKACGIYKTTDGGKNWVSTSEGLLKLGIGAYRHYAPVWKIAIAPSNPYIIYAGLGTLYNLWGRVYKSEDAGESWHNASGKRRFLKFLPQIQNLVLDVAVDPANSDIVYAGLGGNGIYKSINGGSKWAEVKEGNDIILPSYCTDRTTDYYHTVVVSNSNPAIIYSGANKIKSGCVNGAIPIGPFESSDAGSTWNMITLPDLAQCTHLAVDPNSPDILYASTMSYMLPISFDPIDNKGVFKSLDGGNSWEAINNAGDVQLSDFPIYKTIIDSNSPDTLYAVAGFEGIYKSVNSGINWEPLTKEGLPPSTFISNLGLAGLNLYALTSNGIYLATLPMHTLTATKQGSGTITSVPSGIDCGTDCSAQYIDGTLVTVTAVADSGWIITSFRDDVMDEATIRCQLRLLNLFPNYPTSFSCPLPMYKSRNVIVTFHFQPLDGGWGEF